MNTIKNKGFTLIELIVVIAIISLLASVVLASLGASKLKARDASLEEEAHEFQQVLELDHTESPNKNYNNLLTGTVGDARFLSSVSDCNTAFTGNYAAKARDICLNIVANSAVGPLADNRFYVNSSTAPDTYSIMIYLPYKQTYFCVGSSGNQSDTAVGDTNNSLSLIWGEPGCAANP